jgi:methylenetetrahydrofolate--tRNA-(uracil-5-)-methyltransferase
MVGFQTKLKHGEQVRIFRMIPGLENAEFARLGGLHRNTFLNSPKLLDRPRCAEGAPRPALRRPDHRLRGLCRSAAIGLIAGRFAAAERLGRAPPPPPTTTALGALLNHITGGHIVTDRAGQALVPADERQFRPVPALPSIPCWASRSAGR